MRRVSNLALQYLETIFNAKSQELALLDLATEVRLSHDDCMQAAYTIARYTWNKLDEMLKPGEESANMLNFQQQIQRYDELLFAGWKPAKHKIGYSKVFESSARAREAYDLLSEILGPNLQPINHVPGDMLQGFLLNKGAYESLIACAEGQSRGLG